MASRLCRSSSSVKAATLIIFVLKILDPKQKAHATRSLARGLRNFLITLQLSPETPLARDACHATRSVLRAATTHHLATGHHQPKGYFLSHSFVKGVGARKN